MLNLPNEIISHIFSSIPDFMFPLSIYNVNKQFNILSQSFYPKNKNINFQEKLISIFYNLDELKNFRFIYKFKIRINYNQICFTAAKNGHLECLKYAHENGCSWDEITCKSAAENGHLECLKYAHENGCSWDEITCLSA